MNSPAGHLSGAAGAGLPFSLGTRTYLMAIINMTPDSFSGDGILAAQAAGETGAASVLEAALQQARTALQHGADIIDVGGESTRPGAQAVSTGEEKERVVSFIQRLAEESSTLISIDTYRAEVAEAALQAGAAMVNDVWGLKADPDLAQVVARFGVPVVLMHNRSSWAHAEIKASLGGRYVGMAYDNLLEDIKRELLESVDLALTAGVKRENIILDPGIGFGKTVEQNLELVDRLGEIKALGFPVLLGVSRKSFIGFTLDLPPDQRLEGTAAASVVGILRGADIVRVHDVGFMSRVVRMTDAILRRPGK